MRWVFSGVVVLHGLIHLMGFAKAFQLAELSALKLPISRTLGVVWLLAALALVVAAFLPWRLLWPVGVVALVLSQAVILSSWGDAKFGTLANIVLLVGCVYGFASRGPMSLPAEYAREVEASLARAPAGEPKPVTEADLGALPPPVQRYLHVTGSVGQPRVFNFRATWKGRIRGAPQEPWMEFTAEQVNVYDASPSRLFLMDAKMKGLPVDVFHRFVGDEATFRVRLVSLVQLVDAKGPELTRSETVTLFNDLCLFAPPMLLDPAIRWEEVDAHTARAHFTRGAQTIAADLKFDDAGWLVDFLSDDRAQSSADGKSFKALRWSTPAKNPRPFGARSLITLGETRWHEAGADWAYGEFELQDIEFNVR